MIISSDTVWQAGQTYVLSEDTVVGEGVSLTIEAGAKVVGGGFKLDVRGALHVQGTAANAVSLDDVAITITEGPYLNDGTVDIAHALWRGGSFLASSAVGSSWNVSITNSALIGVGGWNLTYADSVLIDGNLLIDCGRITTYVDGPITISGNVFIASDPASAGLTIMSSGASLTEMPQVTGNSFLNVGRPTLSTTDEGQGDMNAVGNYWGTTDPQVIGAMIRDANDDPQWLVHRIDFEPFLTAPTAVVPGFAGSPGGDSHLGASLWDVLFGAGGDDSLGGAGGADIVWGGPGHDTLSGGDGADSLLGSEGGDSLDGAAGDDTLHGGAGDDTIDGGANHDTLSYAAAGAGVVVDMRISGPQTVGGGQGQDKISNIERLLGSGYADTLTGGVPSISIVAGAGDDKLVGVKDGDFLDGGDGYDVADYGLAASALDIDLTRSWVWQDNDVLVRIERVVGGAFADRLAGNAAANALVGGAGDDTLHGRGGEDSLTGGDGDDVVILTGARTAYSITATAGGVRIEHLNGGSDGVDLVSEVERIGFSSGAQMMTIEDALEPSPADQLINGGSGADTLTGNDGSDTISSAAGDDSLVGAAGADSLNAGAGHDTLSGGAGNDHVEGGDGDDLLILSGSQSDYMIVSGVTTVWQIRDLRTGSPDGTDAISGIEGFGFNNGATIVSFIEGAITSGPDHVRGGLANDTIDGLAGGDILFGGSGDDSLAGGDDDDLLEGGRGDDTLSGGAGIDRVTYANSAGATGVQVSLLVAGPQDVGEGLGRDVLLGIENLSGTNRNDRLVGDGGANRLDGLAGHDILYGGGGADTLDGGAGFDYVRYDDQAYAGFIVSLSNPALNTGAAAGDVLIGIEGLVLGTGNDVGYGDGGDNYLYGMAGHDNLYGGAGADYLHGGSGFDYARYDAETSGFTASLADPAHNTGAAAGDVFVEIEGLILGSGNDWAYGDAGANYLYGMAGHDNLIGGAGADYLHGGAGFDYVRYDAETSGFTVSLAAPARNSGAAAGDVLVEIEGLVLGSGNDVAYGDAGANYLYGMGGADNLFGGAGADYLHGGAGFDYARYDDQAYGGFTASLANPGANTGAAAGDVFAEIEGLVLGSGDDSGAGNGADNYLYGLGGNDTLDGGGGADHLHGGAGADDLLGGAGADRFVIANAAHSTAAAPDRVLDFDWSLGDLVDVSGVDANPGVAGDQAFEFVGAFTGTAGQVRPVIDYGMNQTRLEFDINGDGVGQEMVVILSGHQPMGAGLVL
ncbi:hypothetical protein ACFODL_02845 [Phenylobacterium terrae]|uniref:Peptidase M10 serralysin C-terminal domain-containing protein n=1 Tax=Phenylobacterium terrae TaxID=2665495 RepID=A0ABW4N3R1_9CAUL